jgi:hypothetical protein
MTLRFTDSFDHYTTNAQLLQKWTTSGGTPATQAGGRNSTNRCYISVNSSPAYIEKVFGFDKSTWIVGGAFYFTSLSPVSYAGIELGDGVTYQVGVYLNNGVGTLSVIRGGSGGTVLATSANVIGLNQWYYIELKALIDNAGTYQVRVNGVDWIVAGAGDTQASATNNFANRVRYNLGRIDSATYLEDVYICDGDGSRNNDFLGDIRIAAGFADAAGTFSQFTPTSGVNYTCIDETTPNDDTDYVATSGVGNIDTYNFAALPVASGTILGIQMLPYARKDDAGSRSISNIIYYNSTAYSGAAQSVGDIYSYYPEIFETNPDTSDNWTVPEVNSAEFGVKLET